MLTPDDDLDELRADWPGYEIKRSGDVWTAAYGRTLIVGHSADSLRAMIGSHWADEVHARTMALIEYLA